MQRASEGAVGADHGRRQRGTGRNDDARRESRGTEPVVDDGRHIGIERLREALLDSRSGDHPQEIGARGERRFGRDWWLAAAAADQRCDADWQRRRDLRRRALIGNGGEQKTRGFEWLATCGRRQPVAEPRKSERTPGAERLNHASPREVLARKAFPHQRHRGFEALRHQIGNRMPAHPDDAALAVGMAQHRLGRHHAFKSVGHSRSLHAEPRDRGA